MISHCLFCQLIQKNQGILFQDEYLIVLSDIQPVAPIHELIIPRQHIATLNDLTEKENWLIGHSFNIVKQRAAAHNIQHKGFRTLFNCNAEGGQAIYHIHLHLVGGRQLQWPPG